MGDVRILEHSIQHTFLLVITDRDFISLLNNYPEGKVLILHSCNYPTADVADVIRRNSIRVAEFMASKGERMIMLDR